MSKDLLAGATRALREADDASELEARVTRSRVLAGLHQARVHRRTRLAFLLPIAATFLAASAWGAATGKARLVWEGIERAVGVSAPAQRVVNSERRAAAVVGPSSPAAVDSARAPLPSDGIDAPGAESRASQQAVGLGTPPSIAGLSASGHAAASPGPETPKPQAEPADPTLALYRAAHTAHFVDHDPVRALAAWDAYLAAAPNGAFAPEAHYNRALSLVRLGRTSEAQSALEPFANGAYGGYRQAEANALLQRLAP